MAEFIGNSRLTTISGTVENSNGGQTAEIRATNVVHFIGRFLATSTLRDFVVSTFGSGGPTNWLCNPWN